jgi:hypothetical protein
MTALSKKGSLMKGSRGWDPTILLTWSFAAFCLCVSLWQGWSCSLRYLAATLRVEETFVPLTALPAPIQLSLCTQFDLDQSDPADDQVAEDPEDFFDGLDMTDSAEPGLIPTWAVSTAAFWQELEAQEGALLSKTISDISFWNETTADWEYIYQSRWPRNETSLFKMAVYPYEDNSTLLCHTLQAGLAEFGTRFRIQDQPRSG